MSEQDLILMQEGYAEDRGAGTRLVCLSACIMVIANAESSREESRCSQFSEGLST
jgi:hypothetical protein